LASWRLGGFETVFSPATTSKLSHARCQPFPFRREAA
jgi:hypothetical protein